MLAETEQRGQFVFDAVYFGLDRRLGIVMQHQVVPVRTNGTESISDERVETAFDRLSDEQREVISLAHVVGLSRAEIAARLGKSEGAVRTMLSRALADLADEVKSDEP